MILSVSRRTDIPAFYSDWFYNRIKEGFVYVRNPMNSHQVSKICIHPEVVDCIVFWTKNPQPMLERLNELKEYSFYFQFTLNPYTQPIERCIPSKQVIITTFKKLSDVIGPERMVWRYDPILLSGEIDLDYHYTEFSRLADTLKGFSNRCIISFIDLYRKIEKRMLELGIRSLSEDEVYILSAKLAEVAKENGFEIETCAEKYNLEQFGIHHASCVDKARIESLVGTRLNAKKDPNQRKACGCIASIDIGEYNTCHHNCAYCYANSGRRSAVNKNVRHNSASPFLIGEQSDVDTITVRKVWTLTGSSFK